MAKYNVYLNAEPAPIQVEAETAEAAIDNAISETKSQRDRRNFRAILAANDSGLSVNIPDVTKGKKGKP